MQLCCQLLQDEVLNEFEYENGCLERANLKIDKICQPGISDTKAGYTWPHAQVEEAPSRTGISCTSSSKYVYGELWDPAKGECIHYLPN